MKLNQYEWDPVIDLIAEGAFAEVFRAMDTNTTNRYVALKIYKEAVSKGSSVNSGHKKYSLEKEFQNVDGLSHSNIISYFGLDYIKHVDAMGRSSSYAVLIMEYANEGTLTDLMRTDPDNKLINKIIYDILQGVRYLHSEGIIHRDLKPGNILITRTRKGVPIAKITDFGISRDTFSDNTILQSMTEGVGTPHYMAPEQIYKKKFGLNGELSNRTDIWALGVIIYRILTNTLPFGHNSKDFDYVREAIVNESPDYANIPSNYLAFLKACFKKEASERPNSIDELIPLLGDNLEKTVSINLSNDQHEKNISPSDNFSIENQKTVYQVPLTKESKDVIIEKVIRARRVLAWGADFIITLLIAVLFSYLYYVFFKKQIDTAPVVLTVILMVLYWVFYFVFPELKYGKTLGNHIFGLGLINQNKGKIKTSQIIVRNIIKVFTIFGLVPLVIIIMNIRILFFLGDNKSLSHTLSVSYFWLLCFAAIVSIIFNKTLHDQLSNLLVIRNPKGRINLSLGNFYVRENPESRNERMVKLGISGFLLLITVFLIRMAYFENYRFADISYATNGRWAINMAL